MLEVLVNRLGGLSLPRKSVVRLTDRPDLTLDVYRGRETTIQQQQLGRNGSITDFQSMCQKIADGMENRSDDDQKKTFCSRLSRVYNLYLDTYVPMLQHIKVLMKHTVAVK